MKALASYTRMLAVTAAFAGAVGCGTGDGAAPADGSPIAPAPTADPGRDVGSLSFALTAQNGVEFATFTYAVTGPNFSKSGNIEVANSTTVSALIDGIPAGAGYSITLQGTSAPPDQVSCSGSAPFAITAGVVTTVPISLACHVAEQPPPSPVPVPPFVPAALGLALLAIGGIAAGRRRNGSL